MKRKHTVRTLIILLVCLAVIAVAAIGFFGKNILLYIAPKAVLTSALDSAFSQLEQRFQGSPLLILADVFSWDGKYQAVMDAETTNDLLGTVSYDMTVNADAQSHRLLAQGTVQSRQRDLDITLYLDDTAMAISSEDLLQGSFYGITYDTFSSDIREFPLISMVVPDATIQEWEASVSGIKQSMSRSYALPQLPDISEAEMTTLMLGIMALPSRVTSENLQLNGETFPCQKISYSASGTQVGALVNAQSAAIAADFYLYESTLMQICVNVSTDEREVTAALTLGEDLLTCPILMQYAETNAGVYRDFVACVSTQRDNDSYAESWSIHKTGEGEESLSFSYAYDTASGDIQVTVGQAEPVFFNLTKDESGVHLQTDDLSGLLQTLEQKKNASNKKISCTMTLSEGREVASPAYKNLDAWSMEDLLILLGGIGSLIGFQMN